MTQMKNSNEEAKKTFFGRTRLSDSKKKHSQTPKGSMEKPQESTATDNSGILDENTLSPITCASNIIQNHDFARGLDHWHPNFCHASVILSEPRQAEGEPSKSVVKYALVTDRKECWQGLEQDITSRISPGSTYRVSACVGVSGSFQGSVDVMATLKLELHDSETSDLSVGIASVSKERWENLEGTFTLPTMPDRVILCLKGPLPGVDLMIKSVQVTCSNHSGYKILNMPVINSSTKAKNIILNHNFSTGLQHWHPNCCDASVVSTGSEHPEGMTSQAIDKHAVITNRKECWQGLEQDITGRVSPGCTYVVSACVGVSAPLKDSADVLATLKLVHHDSAIMYQQIAKASVSRGMWETLEGTFRLSNMPDKVVFYLEGPPPGIELLIKDVVITCSNSRVCKSSYPKCDEYENENIILNPNFDDGLNNWSGRGCKIMLHDSMANGKIVPLSGKYFAAAIERTQSWNGIQQEITGRVQRKLAYDITAIVRIYGNNVSSADVRATLWVQAPNFREQYIGIANVQATDKDWVQLQGKFLLNASPLKVVIYLEGPPPGTDILVNNLSVKHAEKVHPSPPPVIENAAFGINIIQNSSLHDGTDGWFPLGNCNLSVGFGSPQILPPMARDSLGPHEPLSGRYILVKNRTQNWMGPAQMITDKIKLYMTYQVSAWVRIGFGASGSHTVNVALSVDGQWVNGGQVEVGDGRWHEVGSAFRIEKQPSKVMVYVQGPAPGVDLMVAGLQIFPVDRRTRFDYLRIQADKIRKRDVILKFSPTESCSLFGTFVIVKQTQNSFPLGSCINRSNIDNEDFVNFFVEHFNWAVFGNELKWYWTEAQQGKFNYQDADDMLKLCKSYNIETRGHCIFWEVDGTVQQWVKALNKNELMNAVQNRLTGLLTRYKGQFKHYDVNNEMLHGSFYQDRLGKDIRAYMFKTAHELDPSAVLFVNDYHIEDGYDGKSSPEKYIDQILNLQESGAPVGGIGIQGHIDSPVGPIVCSALDKLGVTGLPIWFTELDVSSMNEYVRADDLEVMLREAFAHPAVEGIMLWGFWELFMSRDNAYLVNAEGEINEAGKRFLDLKQEWLSCTHGHVSEQGEFMFRGFCGTYNVEIITGFKKITKKFVVDKGESPLVVSIEL